MAISTGAALLGGAAIGAASNYLGADKAGDAVKGAAKSSNALQKYMYDTNRADQAPYRQIGTQALQQLGSLYGFSSAGPAGQPPGDFSAFYNSPDYQFAVQQGVQARDRSAASKGRLYSGAQLQAIDTFGQQMGSQQFGNYANRLAGIAGIGQSATNQLGQYGQNYANNVGQNNLYAGNAQASSYMNRANALSGFVGDAAYGYGRSQAPVYGLSEANSQWGMATGQNPYG